MLTVKRGLILINGIYQFFNNTDSHFKREREPKTRPKFKRGSVTVVYYESRKKVVKTRPIYECRWDERLKTKPEKSTLLVYTGLLGWVSMCFFQST